MDVIPVIDIRNGEGVHASGGLREKYLPVNSPLCPSSEPVKIAATFKHKLKLNSLYIADLDSIVGRGSNLDKVSSIKERTGMKVFLDLGFKTLKDIPENILSITDKIILSTETIADRKFVSDTINVFGPHSVIVSLDIKDGALLDPYGLFGISPAAAFDYFTNIGVVDFIFLDLSGVGSENGPGDALTSSLEFCTMKGARIITGGGLGKMDDIRKMFHMDVSGVLLGTALHNLNIGPEEIDYIRSW